jgi:hypothetical protein
MMIDTRDRRPSPRSLPPRGVILSLFIIISAFLPAEQARAGFRFGNGGRVAPLRWNPLFVSMELPPERGRVEIRVLRYGAPPASESYPLDSSGRAECPVFMDGDVEAVEATLREGNRVLGRERIDPWKDAFPGHIVLTSGLSTGARMAIAGVLLPLEPVHVAALASADFPGAAVDYDGASAVVLEGDALSLNPAQRDALRAFIAGGGVLVLAGPRPERFNAIDPGLLASVRGGPSAAFGSGRIVLLERGPGFASDSRGAEFWKGILRLGPFETSRRLTVSGFMGAGADAEASKKEKSGDAGTGGAPDGIAIAIAAWAAAASALLAVKRRRIAVVAAASALSFIGLWAAGGAFDRAWRRGVAADVRLIALPGGSGVIADLRLRMRTGGSPDSKPGAFSPRMARIALEDAEGGAMDPVLPFQWRHEFRLPYLSVVSADSASLRMAGVLPAAVLSGAAAADEGSPEFAESIRSGACVVLGKDGEFRSGGGSMPSWSAERMGWMRSVAEAFRGQDIAFGFDTMPALGFTVQGAPPGRVLWARPMRGI